MRFTPPPGIIAATAFAWLLPTADARSGEAIKLNTSFPPGGEIYFFRPSHESVVIYLAEQERDGVFELYRASAAGGEPVKLNGPLVEGGDVSASFTATPDGSRVIYRADQEMDERIELYSVPIDGGPAIKLNGPLAGGGSDVFSDFILSPDGSSVVFRAPSEDTGVDDLFSAPVAGGPATRLNPPGMQGVTSGPRITADGQRVVYQIRIGTSVFELYSVPLAGGPSVKLNAPLVAGGRVFDHKVSPDGARVIYTAEQDTDGVLELYSVPAAGGPVVKLNPDLAAGGNVTSEFRISPDGSSVVFRANPQGAGVHEIFRTPTEGGPAIRMNGALVAGGSVLDATRTQSFDITPDGSRIIYLADQDTAGVLELYSVSIHGGEAVKLNGPLIFGGDVDPLFQISPDGSRIVYRADQETNGVSELFSVPVAGGPVVKLNDPLPVGGRIEGFETPPDTACVIYTAGQDDPAKTEVYRVPIDGGFPVKLNSPLAGGGDVSSIAVSDDGSWLFYRADQETPGTNELFSVRLATTSYADFHQLHTLTSPPDGDDDLDGISNILEYVLGGNPNGPDLPSPVSLTSTDAGHRPSFALAASAGRDARVEMQTSTHLAGVGPNQWVTIATREDGRWSGAEIELTRIGNGLVSHFFPSAVNDDRRFYRLKASIVSD